MTAAKIINLNFALKTIKEKIIPAIIKLNIIKESTLL